MLYWPSPVRIRTTPKQTLMNNAAPSLMRQFIDEAMALLEQESNEPSVTKLQGLYGDEAALNMEANGDMSRIILELHTRLVNWQSSLPRHLGVSRNAPSSVLTHQSYYQTLVINLLLSLSAGKYQATVKVIEDAVRWRREAALTVIQIIRIHQDQYGMAHMSIFLIQPITCAAFVLVDCVDQVENEAELIDLCVFFRAMSRWWPFATAALRLFQLTVQRQGKTLREETHKLFKDLESRDWKERHLQRVRSLYPAVADREDGNGEVRTMSDVFARFASLDVLKD